MFDALIISVSPEKNQPSSNMLESTGCDINLDVSNDILVGSTFFISLSDLNTKKISSCEARLMYDFFNISGANYAQSNLSPVDRNITSMLTLEFYRWLRSNELYPNTSEELKANVKIFLQYIIESFKKVK